MSEGKQLYIISGCNGAGKTTASYTVLPEVLQCKEFVNADEIARGLSPFNPEGMAIEAGRLMLKRIAELMEEEESFSIETTLATRSYARLVKAAQKKESYLFLVEFTRVGRESCPAACERRWAQYTGRYYTPSVYSRN